MNLYEFIKSNDFRGFSLKLIRRFTKQMLSSLVLLKGHRVIHCDLKPENILLAHPARTEIKVIDFGSSCFENEKGAILYPLSLATTKLTGNSIYVYPVAFLPLSRSHPRNELRSGNRYVVARLHPGGVVYRLPHLPRRKRARAVGMHHGSLRTAGETPDREIHASETVFRLTGKTEDDCLQQGTAEKG